MNAFGNCKHLGASGDIYVSDTDNRINMMVIHLMLRINEIQFDYVVTLDVTNFGC